MRDRFALTFDDGPSPTWTPKLLEVLASCGAHATFFPLARNLRAHGALARRALEAGHELGVHGDWHLPPALLPWPMLSGEIEAGLRAVRELGGRPPRWYRPPFGAIRRGQCRRVGELGLRPVLGDVYPRDVERPGVERIVERVFESLRAGSILILHDSSGIGDFDRSQSVEAAGRIVAEAARRGWRAVTLSDLAAVPTGIPALR